MIADSAIRPQSDASVRFRNVVLPATVDLIQAAIRSSIVDANNAPDVVRSIASVVADLTTRDHKTGLTAYDVEQDGDLPGLSADVMKVISDYQNSYISVDQNIRTGVPVVQVSPEAPKRKVGRPRKVPVETSSVLPTMATRPATQSPVIEATQKPQAKTEAPISKAKPAQETSASAAPVAKQSSKTDPALLATPSVTRRPVEQRTPIATPRPVQESAQPSLQVNSTHHPSRRKSDRAPAATPAARLYKAPPESSRKLPKGLSSINDAISMDAIVCLEDGRKVKDLAKHLEGLGIEVSAYLKKWNLPSDYPMRAPKSILGRGLVREFDPNAQTFRPLH